MSRITAGPAAERRTSVNGPERCWPSAVWRRGCVFDWKSRQYMGPIMYCVMMLSTTDR